MIGHANQLIADSGPGCAQLLEPGHDSIVAGAANAADDRHGGARAGQHLSKRQPRGAGATADQYDVVSTEREAASAKIGQRAHHRLGHRAVAVDDELAELSWIGPRYAPC